MRQTPMREESLLPRSSPSCSIGNLRRFLFLVAVAVGVVISLTLVSPAQAHHLGGSHSCVSTSWVTTFSKSQGETRHRHRVGGVWFSVMDFRNPWTSGDWYHSFGFNSIQNWEVTVSGSGSFLYEHSVLCTST